MVNNEAFDAVAWINTPRWQTSRLGLERTVDLLDRLGRPQDSLKFVHVAGTNGKGSTCAYVASALQAAGYKTGLFTSPYIETFEERIRINGCNISKAQLNSVTLEVRKHATAMEAETGDHPTEFELMTAVALEHFRNQACDIVVLEVGLGGRLDSTNVIEAPEVSVITRIGLDHTALLGNTLEQVAGEKAGIVKAGVPVVSWPQEQSALAVVMQEATAHGCEVTMPDFSRLEINALPPLVLGEQPMRTFKYKDIEYKTQLLGNYQPFNAALALEVLKVLQSRGWNITDNHLTAGLEATKWPGRFEVVGHKPLTIIDGGHNPQGAQVLAQSIEDVFGSAEKAQNKVTFVVGVLADKDYEPMISEIIPYAESVYTYAPSNPRALSAEELVQAVRKVAGKAVEVVSCVTPEEALRCAQQHAGEKGVVVAFGSLYSIADLKMAL